MTSNLEARADLIAATLVIGCSWGNDTVATVQFVREAGFENVTCLYNDTGWAQEGWAERVDRMEAWARAIGYRPARTVSEGMEALVRRKKGWPRQGMQFCTEALKIGPTIAWLAENDPERLVTGVNGKRAAESTVRTQTVEWINPALSWGGRRLWQPLHAHLVPARDALIERAGHAVLPHKSKECFCVNTGREGLRLVSERTIARTERLEREMGERKTMFRPARKMGATGIREVVAWAKAARGRYDPRQPDLLDDGTGPSATATGCDEGFCAS
jgi:3'-phosphoadenosine 5'-phosphosulfate sulfotransferase (PAPS reductase)/FAD synthetase